MSKLSLSMMARAMKPQPKCSALPMSILASVFRSVIAGTLRSLLNTEYRGNVEVVVVDDGSRDETAAEVQRIADVDPRVRLPICDRRHVALALKHGVSR